MSNCQKSKRWTGNKFSDQRVTKLCKHLLVCYAPTLLPPTQFISTYICTMIWSLLPYSPFLDFQFLKPSTKTTIADLIMKHADLLLNWVICTSNVGVIKLYCLKRFCANIECHKILVFSPPYMRQKYWEHLSIQRQYVPYDILEVSLLSIIYTPYNLVACL